LLKKSLVNVKGLIKKKLDIISEKRKERKKHKKEEEGEKAQREKGFLK
jgi:hypothetical protein